MIATPNQKGTRPYGVRNCMNLLLILSGIAIAIAAMLGIFVHFKDGAIWFTWLGVVLATTAAFVWFQGLVWERDGATPMRKPDSSPTIAPATPNVPLVLSSTTPAPTVTPTFLNIPTPTPIPPPATAPSKHISPVTKLPVPIDSSIISLTPAQIFAKIEAASVFSKDSVKAACVGLSVDWTLNFASASPSGNTMLAFFVEKDKTFSVRMVMCKLPLKGNERLPLKNDTDRFRVRGIIEEVGGMAITLNKVSLEQIHE